MDCKLHAHFAILWALLLMFLALQRSTYAAIHDLVARAMFLEAVALYLFLKFLRPIQGENLAWSTAIFPVF